MTGELSAAERRRAIFALAMSPHAATQSTAARVAALAQVGLGALERWIELRLAFAAAGTDLERIVAVATSAGEILDQLVPLPALTPAGPGFTVTVDPATMPLYLGTKTAR